MLEFDTYYHIYNQANGDDQLFREDKNYDYFLKKYSQHIDPVAETISWCLMPNHFHFLVKIKDEKELASTFPKFQTLEKFEDQSRFVSKQFSNFFSSYSQSFNKIYHRKGSLFLKNFKRKQIQSEDYLRKLILYIHLNPVKHGFVDSVRHWKWSSYRNFPTEQNEMMVMFFDDFNNYQFLHREFSGTFDEYDDLETQLT